MFVLQYLPVYLQETPKNNIDNVEVTLFSSFSILIHPSISKFKSRKIQ